IPQCTKDGVIIGNQCLFLSKERTNWEGAKQKCEATHHGRLAVLADANQTYEVVAYLAEHTSNDTYFSDYLYWVGGSDMNTEGTWLDGRPLEYARLPWASNQPNFCWRLRECLMVAHDGYYGFPCYATGYHYICELGISDMEDPSGIERIADPKTDGSTRKNNANCVAPWVYGGNSSGCFLFVQKSLDWDSARTYCLDNGGDLIIIDKDNKRSDIVNHYELSGMINTYIWIGGNDHTGNGLMLWNNGNPVKNVFNYGLLNDEFGQNMCLFTDIYGHHDPRVNFCSHSLPNFICEK
ncbi:unnamed protein product, partial [Meganyctiphanes norvegica]